MKIRQLLIVVIVIFGFVHPEGYAESKAKNLVTLAHGSWLAARTSAVVAKTILENRLGYQVKLIQASVPNIWEAVAEGKADAMLCAWLPDVHKKYFLEFKDRISDLGPNLRGAMNGIAVPPFVTIDSIPQMNRYHDRFKDEIIGGEPGTGMMIASEKAVSEYRLNLKLVPSEEKAMTSILRNRILRKEWVAVIKGDPHWIFQKFHLKFLKDPKKIFGDPGFVNTIVRKDLKNERPGAYRFLERFHWSLGDIRSIMIQVEEGEKLEKAAEKWIKNNPDIIVTWLN